MMENTPPISAENLVYECEKCKCKFNRMRYWSDYGYRRLECLNCGVTYFVDSFKDPFFDVIRKLSKEKFLGHVVKAPLDEDPELIWFEKEFESSCDSCKCGGRLEFSKSEMHLKCPECHGACLRVLRTTRKYSAADLNVKWVSHNDFKKGNA